MKKPQIVHHNLSAYTLVEVLIVVSLVIVLAGVGITIINPEKQRSRAEDSVLQKSMVELGGVFETYKAFHGSYPISSNNTHLTNFRRYLTSFSATRINSSGTYFYAIQNADSQVPTGDTVDRIYWYKTAATDGCLQARLNDNPASYIYWVPGTEVQIGSVGCMDLTGVSTPDP